MPKRKQTKMTFVQIIGINDWLKTYKHRIESTEMTQGEVQKRAIEELGFDVPISTLQHLAKIVGVKWAKSPPPPAPVPIDREAIIILISSLCGLYIETTGSVPKILEDLKSNYVQNQKKSETEVENKISDFDVVPKRVEDEVERLDRTGDKL